MSGPHQLRLPCAITPADALEVQLSKALLGVHVTIERAGTPTMVVLARADVARLGNWLTAAVTEIPDRSEQG
jgi:hypothetical protein